MFVFSFINEKRIVILYILKNKDMLTADAFKNFRFKFPIHKVRKAGIYLKTGNTDLADFFTFMHTGRK